MILIKQHNATGTAHLYEHLFEVAVHNLFRRHDLSPYVDYSLHTQALTSGIIYVDIRLYAKKAQALTDEIKSLLVPRDEQSIASAVTQVMAELEKAFKVTKGMKNISDELRQMDTQPWQEIDDLDEIDPKEVKIAAGSFYTLKDAEVIPARDVRVSFTLDAGFAGSHRELLPLFWQLARLMNASVKAGLHETPGIYSKEVAHINTHELTQLAHSYFLHRDIPLKASALLDLASFAVGELQGTNGITRFVSNLRTSNLSDAYGIAPNPSTVFHQSGILIGAKGWRRIATEGNSDLILSHMEVTACVEDARESSKVSAILDHAD